MKRLIILPVLLIFFSCFASGQIKFVSGSLSDIMNTAKTENKIVMVDVLTDWCKWCIELDNKVYSNNEVSAFANENQINYKIDAEKGEGIDFAKKYNIKGYPTVLFLKPDGTEIDRIVGYIPVRDFLENIRDYHKGINTFSYLQDLVAKEPENVQAFYRLGNKYMTLGDLDNARMYFDKVVIMDPDNKNGKTDDAKLALAQLSGKEKIIDELNRFIEEYHASDVLKDAYISLSENLYYVKEDKDLADKMFLKTMSLYPDDEAVRSSYGQYKNAVAVQLADKGTGDNDYKQGLVLINEALPLIAGSVNEASSYYIQSKLYYNLKEYDKALTAVDKAIKIFDRKLYRDHKDKVEKQLSSK